MKVTKRVKAKYNRARACSAKYVQSLMLTADVKLATNPLNSSARMIYRLAKATLDNYYFLTFK